MATRDEFVTRLKAKLDEWNAEIDELEAKAAQQKARADQRYAEQIVALKQKRDEAAEKLKEIQGATGDAWESLKSGAETLWDGLSHTLKESKAAFLEGLQDD